MRTDYCADAPGPCTHRWQQFGTNVDRPGPLEFRGEDEAGMPTEERGLRNPCADIEPLGFMSDRGVQLDETQESTESGGPHEVTDEDADWAYRRMGLS